MKRKDAVPLTEAARLKKMRTVVRFFGKGLWKGDLSEMREDQPRRRKRSRVPTGS